MRFRIAAGWVLLVLSLAGIECAGATSPRSSNADPEGGAVANGSYANPYFGLRYPLPTGWQAGARPPRPSFSGYYVLATPAPPAGTRETILVAAQDEFFADPSNANVRLLVRGLTQHFADPGGAAPAPARVKIGGRDFVRLDLPGSPLSRIVLATEIRCHVLIFVFAGADPEELKRLAAGLDRLSFTTAPAPPVCVAGYATPKTVRHRVEPAAAGRRFADIPVRIVIGADGQVRHIHVIRADPGQRRNIEAALKQWRFAPLLVNGRPQAVETGLRFESKAEPGGG